MCGRFAQALPLGKLNKIDLFSDLTGLMPYNYNTSPGETAAIIIHDKIFKMLSSKWGFVNREVRSEYKLNPFINAKSETVAGKKYFSDAFRRRRCIIPVNGFYEWKTTGRNKEPFYFFNTDDPDESLIFLGGIYSGSSPADTTFAVLTASSVEPVSIIHERMPVIISQDKISLWLGNSAEPEALSALMVPDQSRRLNMVQVTPRMNNTRYKSEDCIKPVSL